MNESECIRVINMIYVPTYIAPVQFIAVINTSYCHFHATFDKWIRFPVALIYVLDYFFVSLSKLGCDELIKD